MLVQHKKTSGYFAMKILDKAKVHILHLLYVIQVLLVNDRSVCLSLGSET